MGIAKKSSGIKRADALLIPLGLDSDAFFCFATAPSGVSVERNGFLVYPSSLMKHFVPFIYNSISLLYYKIANISGISIVVDEF
jgi:hypothetical protein